MVRKETVKDKEEREMCVDVLHAPLSLGESVEYVLEIGTERGVCVCVCV